MRNKNHKLTNKLKIITMTRSKNTIWSNPGITIYNCEIIKLTLLGIFNIDKILFMTIKNK